MIKKEVLAKAFESIVNRDITPAIAFGETAEAYEYANIMLTLILELEKSAEAEDLPMLVEWKEQFSKIREDLEQYK